MGLRFYETSSATFVYIFFMPNCVSDVFKEFIFFFDNFLIQFLSEYFLNFINFGLKELVVKLFIYFFIRYEMSVKIPFGIRSIVFSLDFRCANKKVEYYSSNLAPRCVCQLSIKNLDYLAPTQYTSIFLIQLDYLT